MFDRTVLVARPAETREVTKHIKITEHRAPTDDSVRLLAEMEARARERVIAAIHVGDTRFECVVHLEKTFADDTVRLKAVFSLNGKNLTAEHIERVDSYDPLTAIAGLREAIAKEIAGQILMPALARIDQSRLRFGR